MASGGIVGAVEDHWTVGRVAELAHVSVRTLHHYDEIGLVRPSGRTAAGYRTYSADDVERLREVLGYRRLGFGLREVAELVGDPSADAVAHLRRLRGLLLERRARSVLAGLGCAAVAMTAIALVAALGAGAVWLLPAMLLIAAGMGFGLVGLQYIAVSGTTDEDAGIASGVQRAADQLGGAAGVAVYVGIGFAPTVHSGDPFLAAPVLAVAGLAVGASVISRSSAPTEVRPQAE